MFRASPGKKNQTSEVKHVAWKHAQTKTAAETTRYRIAHRSHTETVQNKTKKCHKKKRKKQRKKDKTHTCIRHPMTSFYPTPTAQEHSTACYVFPTALPTPRALGGPSYCCRHDVRHLACHPRRAVLFVAVLTFVLFLSLLFLSPHTPTTSAVLSALSVITCTPQPPIQPPLCVFAFFECDNKKKPQILEKLSRPPFFFGCFWSYPFMPPPSTIPPPGASRSLCAPAAGREATPPDPVHSLPEFLDPGSPPPLTTFVRSSV